MDILELEGAYYSMGLHQIMDSSIDSVITDDDGDSDNLSFTLEEIVLRRLQATPEEQSRIEQATIGQHLNAEWFKQRSGRLTTSKAKRYCGKGNPAPLLRAILSPAST